jgi:hypothetical protein
MPISLSDTELRAIMDLAAPITRSQRGSFLQAVASELQQLHAHGDGAAYRVARDIQRRFLNATAGPLPAMRSARGMGRYR